MYSRFSRFLTYRRFYVWRARYNYVMRSINGWTWVYALLFLGLVYSCWIIWKLSDPPVPRVHPEAAKMQVRMIREQSMHRVAVAHYGVSHPGQDFTSADEVRAATLRALRARELYLGEESKQLQADMLADISDYIRATGVCAPFICWHVKESVAQLRRAGERTARLDAALRPMLHLPDGALPPLEGDLNRLQNSWSDSFHDVVFHGWMLSDIQVLHERMMEEYPRREPMPWLSRLMDKPLDPRYAM